MPDKVTIAASAGKTSAMISVWIAAAAINGVLAVAAGAAASHLFADDVRRLALMDTGVRYAMYHAVALLALAALAAGRNGLADRFIAAAAWLFIAGTLLFSGSLYLLALTGVHAVVWVTPFGGIAFMLGWAVLGAAAWRGLRRRP